MTGSQSIVVSCPGKVLVAGGYLVLDRQHKGFVISTPSRFYTVVEEAETTSIANESATCSNEGAKRVKLSVKSPQFDDGHWEYEASLVDGNWRVIEVDSGSSSNSFVHLSLQATLQIASARSPWSEINDLAITIVGSNDFYSQSREDTKPIPFAPLNCTIRNVHKTGLGSSAAMVTSLTSSLFLHWTSRQSKSVPTIEEAQLMHNLAQYVHSLAQGKIGSGFDVSAAMYGSQVYQRFDVNCLGDLLDADKSADSKISSAALLAMLSPSHNPLWTSPSSSATVSPFGLPPHMTLLLADVDAGSNTPSMVGKVLAWKKAQPAESQRVWDGLSRVNEQLKEVFIELRKASEEGEGEDYKQGVAELSKMKAREWSASSSAYSSDFARATSTILDIRKLMREMGEASGVPIEPPSQTRLLNAISEVEGVVGAGVPGAGGYDAIWVLCLTPSNETTTPLEKVEKLLTSWTEMSVRPLSRNAWVKGTESGKVGSERGLLRETLENVEGLREAVERARKLQ